VYIEAYKIAKQVCRFELAKCLAELGIKQESLFYYIQHGDGCVELNFGKIPGKVCYSAFTSGELGDILLPQSYFCIRYYRSSDNRWNAILNLKNYIYSNIFSDLPLKYEIKIIEEGEADCRAETVITLFRYGFLKRNY
jgi:hypothetical protein